MKFMDRIRNAGRLPYVQEQYGKIDPPVPNVNAIGGSGRTVHRHPPCTAALLPVLCEKTDTLDLNSSACRREKGHDA